MGLKSKCAAMLLALASPCLLSFAQNHSGAFAGGYAIENVVDQGKTVQVTMSFRLLNGTDVDLENALLILSDHPLALPPKSGMAGRAMAMPVNHGSARIALIRRHHHVELKNLTFTVPAFEYHQWQRGAHPFFVLSYPADNGEQVQTPVQLVRER